MIPIYLRLAGFLSYRDPVELDFTGFDLACISGSNGAGKSSLLDAITWVLFGQARKRDDSVINTHCTAAEVNLVFGYEGNLYRVQRTKPRDKPTILEFFLSQDGLSTASAGEAATSQSAWKPLTERSVRETEASIENTLRMDYETFINASFFLQGKADQFATQRPSERKRILSSILGLEVWETYRENAAVRRRALETECNGIDGRLQEIQAELAEEAARKEKLAGLEANLDTFSQKRIAQESALENMRRLADSLKQQRRLVETYAQEWNQARQSLGVVENRLRLRQEECEAFRRQLERAPQIEAAYRRWHEVRQELERWEDVAARFRAQEKTRSAPLIEIESARAQLEHEKQGLQSMQRGLEADLARVPQLQEQCVVVERTIQELNQRLERRAEVEQAIRLLHQDLAEARAENPRLKSEMDELKERIDRLEQHKEKEGGGKHAGGEPAESTCPLCGQPLSLHERKKLIAHLKTEGKSLGDRFRQNVALLKDFDNRQRSLEKELQTLLAVEPQIREQGRQLDQLNHKRQQIAQGEADWLAQGAPRLQSLTQQLETNAFAPEAQKRLAKIDAELKEFGYDAAAHDDVRREEVEGRSSEIEYRNLETARAALNPLEREIADLEVQVAANREDVARRQAVYEQASQEYEQAAQEAPDVDKAELELLRTREQENRLRLEVGAARQKVLVLDDLRRRQTGLTAQRDSLTRQVALHKSLERAFSKDGVPALLIEQAMPEIENQANEILQRLSGGAMAISFVTQREYKDKKRDDLKETLDILISDAAGTRDYEMFSGGEAFRVNFAIRLALSRVLAQRAGARLQTLVVDEGFGSQDEQGRQRLIEAINLVHGDFSKILVITHLEELKDAFPNRIEVEKTDRGSVVRVV